MADMVNNITVEQNAICNDPRAAREKATVMRAQRVNSLFYGITQICTFMAGIMTAGAMGMIGPQLAAGVSIMALPSAAPVGIAFLAVAAVATVCAVTSNMIGARFFHSANFDQLELNAQHTAKYLVKEIKRENACVQEHEQNCRSDERSWQQVVKDNPVSQLAR